MAVKSWLQAFSSGITSPHIRIYRLSDGKDWDGSDWVSGETLLPMTENPPGAWYYETAAAWQDGTVRVVIYADNHSTSATLHAEDVRVLGDALMEGAAMAYRVALNANATLKQELARLRKDLEKLAGRISALDARLPGAGQMGN